MLRSLSIKEVYDSEDDNILEDFYIPTLSRAKSYDRAVGYFDAKVLTTAARGLSSFVDNGGYIRLIVGSTLTVDEYDAIADGYSERETLHRLSKKFEESLDAYSDDLFKNQLNTLTWFIQHGKLDIKIALRRGGIYHEKIGIIKDEHGDFVLFQGSANETNNALSPYNYESINVFKSWIPGFSGHIEPHLRKFELLWNNKTKNTKVLEFTELARESLEGRVANAQRPNIQKEIALWQNRIDAKSDLEEITNVPTIPRFLYGQDFNLKLHQKNALNSWRDNDFHGLFELATGAGKTITAIYGAVKILESRKKLFLVIAVPYQSLADQWVDNLKLFNISPIVCYGGEQRWLNNLSRKVIEFNLGFLEFCAVVVVDATLNSKSRTFSKLIDSLGEENSDYFMFVGDECHHHGATANYNSLPRNAGLRIGLSATPERSDDESNAKLEDYYGKTVAKYTMKNALDDHVLTPYEYHLIPVSLTEEEGEQYRDLSKKIGRLIAQSYNSQGSTNENVLNSLLNKRARLVNGSKNKPVILKNLLKTMSPTKHSLFYCAEGSAYGGSSEDDDDGIKQIQIISQLLHSFGWRSSQFTANEDKPRREKILRSFKDGDIDSLVAMKCLDEGIDVPACSTAFILSSSRQPRQFIQRRGRILRKSHGKTKAVIYDFFVTLPVNTVEDGGLERKLLIAELKRINEFSSLCLNKGDVYRVLEPFLIEYDLIHHFV